MTRPAPAGDRLFVAAVLGLGAALVVVWGGAALAAAVGGGRLDASAADALLAASHLPGHLADPGAAWPPAARAPLPGPLLYWATTGALAATVAAVGGGFLLVRDGGVGTARRRPLGVDARPRFGRGRDLAPLVVRRAVPGRWILGRVGRRLVATECRRTRRRRWARQRSRRGDRGAVALIGPSRCGKTTAAVSAILEWSGPAVLASVKSDLLAATLGWRSRQGECRIYDPTASTRHPTVSASPLRGADTVTGAQRAARALCDAAPRSGIDGGADYWFALAEILLSGLLWAARRGGRGMGDVVDWVMGHAHPGQGPTCDPDLVVRVALSDPDPRVREAAGWAYRFLSGIWSLDERTQAGVYGTAQTVVWPWADPGVAAAARRSEIDLDWLLDGANTVYLCAPIEDQRRLAPAFGGLLNDLVKQAYLRVSRTDRPLEPTLLVVVDEAGNTPLRALPEYASTLAGIGVLLVTIWQSVAQLQATYDRHADVILTNHLSKVFYSSLSDPASLDYAARLLGDAEVETRSLSGGRPSTESSTSTATVRVPMVGPHVIRQMRPGDALLVHGTLPPAHLRTRPYHQVRRLAARAALAPTPRPPTRSDEPD